VKTATTSAMLKTVMAVDTFRTKRFRMLYFSGIAIPDLRLTIDDLPTVDQRNQS
jgi:hypothetical protein